MSKNPEEESNNNKLPPERIQKLNEVGFSWDGKEALSLEQYEPQNALMNYSDMQKNRAMQLFITNTKRIRNWEIGYDIAAAIQKQSAFS